jgi:hypothetical protein
MTFRQQPDDEERLRSARRPAKRSAARLIGAQPGKANAENWALAADVRSDLPRVCRLLGRLLEACCGGPICAESTRSNCASAQKGVGAFR